MKNTFNLEAVIFFLLVAFEQAGVGGKLFASFAPFLAQPPASRVAPVPHISSPARLRALLDIPGPAAARHPP